MAENMPLSEVIRSSLENIKKVLDTNTVMGDPVTVLDGTVIVPVSKISVGFASAGTEYNGRKELKTKNFGGGGGTGLSITPVGFLVVNTEGNVNLINMGQSAAAPDAVEQIAAAIERAPEIFAKIKALFKKNDTEDKDAPAEEKAQG